MIAVIVGATSCTKEDATENPEVRSEIGEYCTLVGSMDASLQVLATASSGTLVARRHATLIAADLRNAREHVDRARRALEPRADPGAGAALDGARLGEYEDEAAKALSKNPRDVESIYILSLSIGRMSQACDAFRLQVGKGAR